MPGFITSANSEMFKDCCNFYRTNENKYSLTCSECRSAGRLSCQKGTCEEGVNQLLADFKSHLGKTCDMQILVAQRSRMSPHPHVSHFEQLRRIEFNSVVTKRFGKTVLRCCFQKIHVVCTLNAPWSCSAFSFCAPDEKTLQPEGQSKHKVFQYLSN